MRISHLGDSEIQAYLDRRLVSGSDLAVNDGVEEHLEGCLCCREELHAYKQLFGELAAEPSVSLPRNFAKKVTLSLPPLAAAHTRARVRVWFTGLATVLTVLTLLVALNWKVFLTASTVSLTGGYVTALTWFKSVWSLVPVPNLSGLEALVDVTTLKLIKELLLSEHGTINLMLVAALGILCIASLEGLMPLHPQRHRVP